MRKGQRFTPQRLRGWQERGRGLGSLQDYEPWHQVTRSDPGSRGRSHLINGRFNRLHHLLSDRELVAFGFATMLPALCDLREQYPLPTEDQPADDSTSLSPACATWVQGTQSIAAELKIKHPVVRQGMDVATWVMTTDLLLSLVLPNGRRELLAVSVKGTDELESDRKLQLLRLEREYWRRRGVEWLLLTQSLYDELAALAIRAGLVWSLGQPPVEATQLAACARIAPSFQGLDLNSSLLRIESKLGVDRPLAQAVFWQSVWRGETPIDLAKAIRPSLSLDLLPAPEFWKQNPLAARRSAWLR